MMVKVKLRKGIQGDRSGQDGVCDWMEGSRIGSRSCGYKHEGPGDSGGPLGILACISLFLANGTRVPAKTGPVAVPPPHPQPGASALMVPPSGSAGLRGSHHHPYLHRLSPRSGKGRWPWEVWPCHSREPSVAGHAPPPNTWVESQPFRSGAHDLGCDFWPLGASVSPSGKRANAKVGR